MSKDNSNLRLMEKVTSNLKWFNGPKGFGFLVPEGKDVDAFLHITTLQDAGYHALGNGAKLLCDISFADKGAIVTKIHEIIDSGDISLDICKYNPESDIKSELSGTVKWYKEDEGFGFIIPDDGMKDVFIHKSCLKKNNLDNLETGQKVFMTVKTVEKGREVISISLSSDDKRQTG